MRKTIIRLMPADERISLLLLAALVGAGGAMASLLFRSAFIWLQNLVAHSGEDVVTLAKALPWWGRLLLPMAGGLAGGLLLKFGLHWVQRRGSDDYLEAVTIGDGRISVRSTIIKSLSSLCCIASGASIGREGPMVQLAAMFGSTVGRYLRLSKAQLQALVASGASAGIASAYNSPIAASIFVAEAGMGFLSKVTLSCMIVSAVIADMVVRWLLNLDAVYRMPPFKLISGWEVFAYAGLGVVCGLLAPVFRWCLDYSRRRFLDMPIPLPAQMALGGLCVGLISIWYPEVWGNGYSVVNDILHNPWTWQALVILLVLKIIATALCSGSGMIGGVFTPSLFVGAALGAVYGHIFTQLAWLDDTMITGYAVVGMGAFLASVTYAPLMCILMIFEMTLSYEVVLPLMLACVLGHHIAQWIRPHSIYTQRNETPKTEASDAPASVSENPNS
jgi:CIC family chloride channel protein